MRTKNQKNRERIARRKKEWRAEVIRLKYCTPKVVNELQSVPHPKLPDTELTLWDYVNWCLKQGYDNKAMPFIKPLAELYKEPHDTKLVARIERESEDYGVPRTYR